MKDVLIIATMIAALTTATPVSAQISQGTPKSPSTPSKVETGIAKLANSNIEYFSRGTGEAIVLLPGGTLTVGYLDGLAEALAKAGYRARTRFRPS